MGRLLDMAGRIFSLATVIVCSRVFAETRGENLLDAEAGNGDIFNELDKWK